MVETGETVDISHHASRSVKNLKEVTEQLLSPTADLMDGPVILENFFDGTAITKPEELGAPEEFAVLADSPATATSFANKRMEMPFVFSAAARSKSNRAQPSAIHSQIESANAIRTEQGNGDSGSVRVVGLHEDPTHAGPSPISLEKARKRRVVASKARGGSDAELQFIP